MSNLIDLSKYTTFGIGPKVETEIITDLSALRNNSNAFVLGRGSNLLILDKLRSKVVVNRTQKFWLQGNLLYAESGCLLSFLARHTALLGISGLEWSYMLPASVGGALRMNAGAFSHSIGETVEKVGVYREGEVIELSASECGFSYRKSAFRKDDVILYAYFRLAFDSLQNCVSNINEVKRKRLLQPKGKSAGCIYKTQEKSAGWYIERAKLKGKRFGDIYVSPIHAGFFINAGRGKSEDVLRLMDYVEKCVEDKFGIKLEKEIEIIGEN